MHADKRLANINTKMGRNLFYHYGFSKIFVGSSCHSAAGMSHRTHGNLLKIVAFRCYSLHY